MHLRLHYKTDKPNREQILSAEGRRAVRETAKMLGFAQVVLIFGGAAVPEPWRILTLLPLFTLIGAGLFAIVALSVRFLNEQSHRRRTAAQATPPVDPGFEPTPVRRIA